MFALCLLFIAFFHLTKQLYLYIMLNVKQKEGISMENANEKKKKKIIWYSTEERIMSFHFVVNYTKKIFNSYIDMFRFALGLIDIGFKIM